MNIFQFRNKKGSALTGPLLILIFLILVLLGYFIFNLTKSYFNVKTNSTISGQPLHYLVDNLVDNKPSESVQSLISKEEKNLIPEEEKKLTALRLVIPKIKVNAPVESVGVTANGGMGVPQGSNNVAWYKFGTKVGDIGSAVIDGHYGIWENGTPAVFNDLAKLQTGDEIYVKDSNGSTTTFIVRDFKTYGPNDEATDIFISSDGQAHLNLITCGGKFNKVSKSYPSRLVIFSDKK